MWLGFQRSDASIHHPDIVDCFDCHYCNIIPWLHSRRLDKVSKYLTTILLSPVLSELTLGIPKSTVDRSEQHLVQHLSALPAAYDMIPTASATSPGQAQNFHHDFYGTYFLTSLLHFASRKIGTSVFEAGLPLDHIRKHLPGCPRSDVDRQLDFIGRISNLFYLAAGLHNVNTHSWKYLFTQIHDLG